LVKYVSISLREISKARREIELKRRKLARLLVAAA
jgi:DNA-binding transcriptional regulator YiaG